MKKFFRFAAIAAAALAAAVSCDDSYEAIPVITVPKSVVTYVSGSQWISIAAEAEWTLSVSYGGTSSGWISLSDESGTGISKVLMSWQENPLDDARAATLVLQTASYRITSEVIQASPTPGDLPIWLELPACDQPGLGFFTHANDGSAYRSQSVSGIRNWSFYYDYDAYVSWWVAYPLNNGLIGKGSRSNSWQDYDPLLGHDDVCHLKDGSYGGGWTRGHQIPSADRLGAEANVTTFYPTNLTPQDYYFNGGDNFEGIWCRLETQVRSYAGRCDTLYVVTGCDVRNSTTWSGRNGGHSARVPTHYYKALLRRKGKDFSAVGFYLPHSGNPSVYLDDYMNYIYSISDLEELTGVTFFVNYASLYGKEAAAKLKGADPETTVKNW